MRGNDGGMRGNGETLMNPSDQCRIRSCNFNIKFGNLKSSYISTETFFKYKSTLEKVSSPDTLYGTMLDLVVPKIGCLWDRG